MKIVFFDGVCNLCNGFVDGLIRRDHRRLLKYAPLQGETAAYQLGPDQRSLKTVVYFRDGEVFTKSTAVLMILRDLAGIWKLSVVFWIIPGAVRDRVYDWVASLRYEIFGERETCRLPTAEEEALFLP